MATGPWTYAELTRIWLTPTGDVVCIRCKAEVPDTVETGVICTRDDPRVGVCSLCLLPGARGDIVPPLPEGAVDFFARYADSKVKDA